MVYFKTILYTKMAIHFILFFQLNDHYVNQKPNYDHGTQFFNVNYDDITAINVVIETNILVDWYIYLYCLSVVDF